MKSVKSVILSIAVILGLFFIVTNFQSERIVNNTIISAEHIKSTGIMRRLFLKSYITAIDDIGDLIILNEAQTSGRLNFVNNSIGYPVMQYRNYSKHDPKTNYYNLVNHTGTTTFYPQYWHGYITLYKPLFMLFNITQVRFIMVLGYIMLLGVTFFIAYVRRLNFLYPIIFGQLPFVVPFGVWGLETAPVFYVLMISVLLLCRKNVNYSLTFFFAGFLTAFYDYLTAETIVPSVMLYICYVKRFEFKRLLKLGLLWFAGYSVTMITKWLLVTIFIDKSFIFHVSNLIETTNSLDEGVFAALYNNFDTLLFNRGLVIVFLIALFGIMLWKKAFNLSTLLILSLPIIRIAIMSGHSGTHRLFVCRALVIFVIFIISLLRKEFFNEEKSSSLCADVACNNKQLQRS